MYEISDLIPREYDKLQIRKLHKTNTVEVLAISLEKGFIFPEHTAPADVLLIVLEGEIDFHIHDESYSIREKQRFTFEADTPHWVAATKDATFLIIR